MFDDFLRKALIALAFCGVVTGFLSLVLPEKENETNTETIEITSAKPIYQQQIGDDTTPDILIIYEAEVDGVKVYPSVIKEAK